MDPVALELGPVSIRWYGIFTALGFLAGYLIAGYRAPKRGVRREDVADMTFWIMLGAILGARLFYVIQHWQQFQDRWVEIIRIDHGGLVFYGGFLGASVAVILVSRIKHLSLGTVADIWAPALPAGHALGRIGCFLNGCCFGWPWEGACAVHYPPESGVLYLHQTVGLVPESAVAALPVFPIQLVAAIGNLVICGVLLMIERKLPRRGQLFACYVVLYSLFRFAVEFARGDYPQRYAGMTPAQLLCLILFPVGVAAFILLRKKGAPNIQAVNA